MIYITGDTHGEIERFRELESKGVVLNEDDYIIVCGDFGFIYFDDDKEQEWLDELQEKPYTILWIDGNHENFDAINRYDIEEWNGGKIHRIRKNVLHLMRGQVFNIEGKKIFTMGGAYSIDRYRREENVRYWKAELPSKEEYDEASENLKANDFKVDIIISHTAPKELILKRLELHPDSRDGELTGFLEWVMYECEFKKWYFGHWHIDKEMEIGVKIKYEYNTKSFRALLNDVVKAE